MDVITGEIAAGLNRNLGSEENRDDVEAMIELYGYSRAFVRNENPTAEHFRFGAAVLCIILDPIKPPRFVQQASDFRASFSGIRNSRQQQVIFVHSISPAAHKINSPEVAVHGEFYRLFAPYISTSEPVPA
jgi:hypothetical protein